jgi:hypothetical protein
MLEHLFYKTLMETSSDRGEFLSRLFGRPRVESTATTPEVLFRAYKLERPVPKLFETNVRRVVEYLEHQKGFNLSDEDEVGIRYIAEAFFKSGPDLRYTSSARDFISTSNYSDLATENDGVSHNWNFLATEDQFEAVQRMQKRNLIVPLVGDFAGPIAITSVGKYALEHATTVHAFYTSNVEEYLFADGRKWKEFYKNVSVLPTDSTSTFIRFVLNGSAYPQHRTTLSSSIDSTMRAYRGGGIQSYYDLMSRSH